MFSFQYLSTVGSRIIMVGVFLVAHIACDEDPTALDDAVPSIQVSPWSLDFGERPLLQSAQGTLTVVNDGDLDVDVSRIRIEGNSASMFLVNYNSLSLETNEQAALVVTFTPTIEGPIDANLVLEHEGVLSGVTTVVLQGTGVLSCVADKVVFPDVDRDGYGDRDAAPSNVCEVVAGFSEANTDCDDEVRDVNPAATEICDNNIDDDCDDDVDLDDSDCVQVEPEPEPAPLVALIVSPPALNFGGREQNTTHQASLTVVNPNAEEVAVSLAQITGTNADRFTVSLPNFVIAAGSSVNLVVDFTPVGQAEVSAELLLVHTGIGDGNTVIALSGSGLDNCPQGEIEVFVDVDLDGRGDEDATGIFSCGLPIGYSLTNDDCDDDDETSAPDLPEDCNAPANNDCDAYILDDDDPDCVPGSLIVSPPALDFGARETNVAHQASVTVVNPNAQQVVVSLLQITGTDADRFAVNLPNFALPASGNVNLTLTFTPTSLASANAELLLIHTGIGAGSTTIALSGSGLDPCPQGEVTVYIDNDLDGSGDVNASGMTSCGVPSGYSLTQDDCDDDDEDSAPGLPEDCFLPANNDCDAYVLDVDDPDCAPRSCSTQDDCGLNLESLACPRLSQQDDICRRVCRSDDECGSGLACRGLPGSVSIGFCDDAGAIPLGGTCVTSSDCAQGMCDFSSKTCRALCQSQGDCTGAEVCGRTEYNTLEFGGTNSRHFTTVCRPLGARLASGGQCNGTNGYFYPEYCASDVCDAYPWAFGYSATAQCSEVCSGSVDCASNQVCSFVFNGLGADDRYDDTQEGGGNNIEGMAGCNTVVNYTTGLPVLPGPFAMGRPCAGDRTNCRSLLCGQSAPVAGLCTDFCDDDLDCEGAFSPGWKCRFMQLNHASYFLQGAGLGGEGRLSIVGVCAP